jgi:hypothetical protein
MRASLIARAGALRWSAGAARMMAVLGGVAVAGTLVVTQTHGAFSSSSSNDSNTWSAGSVTLADDDSGNVLFNTSAMKPGDSSTKCVNVSYTGTLTSNVKLYGSVGGTGLASYLTTTIEVGTGAAGGGAMSCTGFTASSTLHNGTLAAFGAANTNFANGLGGFDAAANPTTKSYRLTVALADDNNAQGKNASATFTWEAQSS